MMPSVHMVVANTIAVRTKGKYVVLWFALLIFEHIVLDAIMHIEPGLFGMDITVLFSTGFTWTFLDITLGTAITYRASRAYPEYRIAIWLGYVFALGPDVIEVATSKFLPPTAFGEWWNSAHFALHQPWRNGLSHGMIVATGTIATVFFYLLAWKLRPKTTTAPARVKSSQTATA